MYPFPESYGPVHVSVPFRGVSLLLQCMQSRAIFAELLQGNPLLPGKDEADQTAKMVSCLGRHPFELYADIKPDNTSKALWDCFANLSTEGLTLLTKLLEYDSTERWTAEEALKSNYFTIEPFPAKKMPQFSCWTHPISQEESLPQRCNVQSNF